MGEKLVDRNYCLVTQFQRDGQKDSLGFFSLWEWKASK